jgi:Trypsin-like peptidase domain
VVAPGVLAAAAHTVEDEYAEIVFAPAFDNGVMPYGKWQVDPKRVFIHPDLKKGGSPDYAFLLVQPRVTYENNHAFVEHVHEQVGMLNIEFNAVQPGGKVDVVGYSGRWVPRPDGIVPFSIEGRVLVMHRGEFAKPPRIQETSQDISVSARRLAYIHTLVGWGASGGLLINEAGRVVGVVRSGRDDWSQEGNWKGLATYGEILDNRAMYLYERALRAAAQQG